MTLKQLKYLVGIADSGLNITSAAERLYTSQPGISKQLKQLEAELGVTMEARQTARTSRVHFSADVQAVIAAKMKAAGHTFQHIISGAGHDAQEMAALCPTAMVFVPGEYDGISHNPREYSTPEQCTRGIQMLLETIVELAG